MPIIHIDMPKDIKKIVLDKQAEIKINTGIGQLSQQDTIFRIIKEWHEIVTRNKKFNTEKF